MHPKSGISDQIAERNNGLLKNQALEGVRPSTRRGAATSAMGIPDLAQAVSGRTQGPETGL